MIKHISLRLAWHNNGWNGKICKNPKANIYCVGQKSYPGDLIATSRNLDWEIENSNKHCSELNDIPPCAYSINAFGDKSINAKADPPEFFYDDTESIEFELPPSTACIWPYEAMYGDDVRNPEGSKQTFDYNKRLKNAKQFFEELSPDKSLIFYYANKSNPISNDDNQVYPLIGVARLKNTGDILYYKNVSEKTRKKYANGFVWQMPVTSHYSEEGFRIPIEKYLDNEEILNKIAYIPEHSNNFKYAAKHIGDDDALIYIEKLINIVDYLIEIKDETENWAERKQWLQKLLSELWQNRGAYPGMLSILNYLEFSELIQYHIQQIKDDKEKESVKNIFQFLNDRSIQTIKGCSIEKSVLEKYRKNWQIKNPKIKRELIQKVLCRIALDPNQIENILKDNRTENNIYAEIKDIINNPYILSEQYIGNDYGDEISFTKIDHAVLPSPELGIDNLLEKDSWQRLRALIVEALKSETIHSFVNQDTVLEKINNKLMHYPDWKKELFNNEYIEYDKKNFEEAIYFRVFESKTYLYLKEVWENERLIEKEIRELIKRPDIKSIKHFTDAKWRNELFQSESSLAINAPNEYEKAINSQVEICKKVFTKPISIIAGSAGTGKTTIIKAIINAIKHSSGNTESFCLLAPTGKAADRIREKTGVKALTIHSFLTRNGWMNSNFTFKRNGGKKETEYTTYIIDESSMIDLQLIATLFKAINWNDLTRLILVGDPNQLPPIGKGKIFSDIIDFINNINEEAYGKLTINVRQLENKATGKGTGIIDLASLYIRENIKSDNDKNYKIEAESFIKKIQESGKNIEKDLRIISWKDTDDLETKIVETIKQDIDSSGEKDLMKFQVISPYRGELFGTEYINQILQQTLNGYNKNNKGTIAGITVFDKVIQFVNRSGKNSYYSYNMQNRTNERVEVFNGEMGVVRIHNFDKKYYKWNKFRLQKFQVAFSRKPNNFIEFSSESEVENNIELAYAISVHKAQGSEFDRVYFILPKKKQALLSTELLYTGVTRAQKHLTIFIEEDFRSLISMRRPEKSRIALINSSIFEFKPLPEELITINSWYEEGKIHLTLLDFMVRSKSEVIIANMLFDNEINDVLYEEPLFAPDGSFYLPDFTIKWKGKTYYWEHLGMLDIPKYKRHWEEKKKWYDKYFPEKLITTKESSELSKDVKTIIKKLKNYEI